MLFNPKHKADEPNQIEHTYFSKNSVNAHHGVIITDKQIKELFDGLANNDLVHFCSYGNFSIHDLFAYSVEFCGKSKVAFTTWTLSETPARVLVQSVEQGSVTALYALFDHRISQRKPEGFHLLRDHATAWGLDKVHAKVFAILGEQHSIAIVSSQNLTKNPRKEAGVLHVSAAAAQFHFDWITQTIQQYNDRIN